jgi:HAD superfamily hydrolase (TIGR01509 family)
MPTRFLLWDHDGVLVDTERWYFEATRSTLAALGVELSKERYLALMARGQSSWDLAREAGIAEQAVRAARERRDALYQEHLRTQAIEIEGVEPVLAELDTRYRMAIITTARRADFDIIHRDRSVVRHFELVLTLGDYPRVKPHPDPYLAGLARFGAGPNEAVVLEDSARGLAAARAAGIPCIIIRNEFTASQDFTGAWRLVESIREVPAALQAMQAQTR